MFQLWRGALIYTPDIYYEHRNRQKNAYLNWTVGLSLQSCIAGERMNENESAGEREREKGKEKKQYMIMETYSYHFVVTFNCVYAYEIKRSVSWKRVQQQQYFMNRGFPFGTVRLIRMQRSPQKSRPRKRQREKNVEKKKQEKNHTHNENQEPLFRLRKWMWLKFYGKDDK